MQKRYYYIAYYIADDIHVYMRVSYATPTIYNNKVSCLALGISRKTDAITYNNARLRPRPK